MNFIFTCDLVMALSYMVTILSNSQMELLIE